MNETQQWTSTAGPRQTNAALKAMQALRRYGNTWRELTDMDPDGTFLKWAPTRRAVNVVVETEYPRIFEKYAGTITRENCASIIAELEAATARAAEAVPVIDRRRMPA